MAHNLTFDDFASRASRVSPTAARAEYHRSAMLFQVRPDMLTRLVGRLPWQNALAVMSAAFYTQQMEPATFLAAARCVARSQATEQSLGGSVGASWVAGFRVLQAAEEAYGTAVIPATYTHVAHTCAPGKHWVQALALARHCDRQEVTSPALMASVAQACAAPETWRLAAQCFAVRGVLRPAPAVEGPLAATLAVMPSEVAVRALRRSAVAGALSAPDRLKAALSPWHAALQLLQPRLGAGDAPMVLTDPQDVTALVARTPAVPSAVLPVLAVVGRHSAAGDPVVQEQLVVKCAAAGLWQDACRVAARSHAGIPAAAVRPLVAVLHRRRDAPTMTAVVEAAVARCHHWPVDCAAVAFETIAASPAVPWNAALGWYATLVRRSGSAVALKPAELLTPRVVSAAVTTTAQQGCPRQALRVLARAKDAGLDLRHGQVMEAALFAQRFGRWEELLGLYRAAVEQHGVEAAAPLLVLVWNALRRMGRTAELITCLRSSTGFPPPKS